MKTRKMRLGATGLLFLFGNAFPLELGSAIYKIGSEESIPTARALYALPPKSQFSSLARKDIGDLTLEERDSVNARLKIAESSGDPNAIGILMTHRQLNGEVVPDIILSFGENQINVSEKGALEDYNLFHRRQFTEKDMFNPSSNRIVSRWYLGTRIPQILKSYKLETTVANVLASYNAGPRKLIRSGGDAIKYFKRLPRDTQRYILNITRE